MHMHVLICFPLFALLATHVVGHPTFDEAPGVKYFASLLSEVAEPTESKTQETEPISEVEKTALCQDINQQAEIKKMNQLSKYVQPKCQRVYGSSCVYFLSALHLRGRIGIRQIRSILECDSKPSKENTHSEKCSNLHDVSHIIKQNIGDMFAGELRPILNEYAYLFALMVQKISNDYHCSP